MMDMGYPLHLIDLLGKLLSYVIQFNFYLFNFDSQCAAQL